MNNVSEIIESQLNDKIEPISFLNKFDANQLIEMHNELAEVVESDESENYERRVLYEDEKYELVFCHWKSGGMSEMHHHDGKKCWFRCLKGMLTEKKDSELSPRLMKKNSIAYIDDNLGEHQIMNKTQDCTFSLHLYISES